MKNLLPHKYIPWLLTILFGLVVFLFWKFRYPFALTYQEQFQMFLFDSDYFMERIAEPGGLARYVAEFLVQFYNSPTLGALILTVLMMLVQRLTWRLMRCESHYFLSFLPAVLLWYTMGDESVKLTYVVALLMAMAVAVMTRSIRVCRESRVSKVIRWGGIILLIPVLYWLIGPMVVLAALYVMPLSVVWALAVMLLSAHFVPFPLARVMTGISYYRFPEAIPYILMVIPAFFWVLSLAVRRLPQPKPWVKWCEAIVCCAAVIGCPDLGFEAKKYELLRSIDQYDKYIYNYADISGLAATDEIEPTNRLINGDYHLSGNVKIDVWKTGTTDRAKYCINMVTDIGNDEYTIVILGCDTSDKLYDLAIKMLNYAN